RYWSVTGVQTCALPICAWWQGDCGPYWGHNAIVRIAPFAAHCQLPVLADGALVKGHVLSHDQIEAVLMRRAGYGVRVLPGEGSKIGRASCRGRGEMGGV